jgi:hypothetical protein
MLPLVLCNIDFDFSRQHPMPNTVIISAEYTPQGMLCRHWGEMKLGG